MDARLLEYYNRELRYLRELGGEFARDFPKIAGRLGLDSFECADPYVERLLEGFAFLAARVHLKIDGEFPRFSEQLLGLVCPHYLGPTPSMAVVEFTPDERQGGLKDGFALPRGTALRARLPRNDATCEYRTAHDVTLWPIELKALTVTSASGVPEVRFPGRTAKGSPRRCACGRPTAPPSRGRPIDELTLFFRGRRRGHVAPVRARDQRRHRRGGPRPQGRARGRGSPGRPWSPSAPTTTRPSCPWARARSRAIGSCTSTSPFPSASSSRGCEGWRAASGSARAARSSSSSRSTAPIRRSSRWSRRRTSRSSRRPR